MFPTTLHPPTFHAKKTDLVFMKKGCKLERLFCFKPRVRTWVEGLIHTGTLSAVTLGRQLRESQDRKRTRVGQYWEQLKEIGSACPKIKERDTAESLFC